MCSFTLPTQCVCVCVWQGDGPFSIPRVPGLVYSAPEGTEKSSWENSREHSLVIPAPRSPFSPLFFPSIVVILPQHPSLSQMSSLFHPSLPLSISFILTSGPARKAAWHFNHHIQKPCTVGSQTVTAGHESRESQYASAYVHRKWDAMISHRNCMMPCVRSNRCLTVKMFVPYKAQMELTHLLVMQSEVIVIAGGESLTDSLNSSARVESSLCTRCSSNQSPLQHLFCRNASIS